MVAGWPVPIMGRDVRSHRGAGYRAFTILILYLGPEIVIEEGRGSHFAGYPWEAESMLWWALLVGPCQPGEGRKDCQSLRVLGFWTLCMCFEGREGSLSRLRLLIYY